MNFEDEEYVRVYSRETVTYKKLGWEGRAVFWHLLLKADSGGVIELDEGDDLVEAVSALIDMPESIVSVGLERLASRGVTSRHGASLVIDRFVEAQEAKRSDRLRAQEYRDRKRGSSPTHPPINAAGYESSSRIVTARHESSLLALPPLSLALPPLALPERESAAEAPPTSAHPDEQGTWDGSERETPCPLDIAQRAKALGIPQKLAESLKVPLPAVDALIHDFASYWTIGAGMGQKRRHWMRKLRENVRKEAGKPGGLPAPGAIDHSNLARESRIFLKEMDQMERDRAIYEAEKARTAGAR